MEEAFHCEIGSIPLPNESRVYDDLLAFHNTYNSLHPYFCVTICVCGSLLNLATIAVLTRPTMVNPINILLTAIAICDLTVMLSYLIFVIHFVLESTDRCNPADFSYNWAVFTLFHAHSSVINHSTSLWLTVALAQIRAWSVHRATKGTGQEWLTNSKTVLLTLFGILTVCALNIPNFLSFSIKAIPGDSSPFCDISPGPEMPPYTSFSNISNSSSSSSFISDSSNSTRNNSSDIFNISQPLIPGINLTRYVDSIQQNGSFIFTGNMTVGNTTVNASTESWTGNQQTVNSEVEAFELPLFVDNNSTTDIIQEVETLSPEFYSMEIREQPVLSYLPAHSRKALRNKCFLLKLTFWTNGVMFKMLPCFLLTVSIVILLRILAEVRRRKRKLTATDVRKGGGHTDHTTMMLVAVLSIFLITELPQGLLSVLTGVFSSAFRVNVYAKLGDFVDLLSLINSSVNFIIYCVMSKKFRDIFCEMFLPNFLFKILTEKRQGNEDHISPDGLASVHVTNGDVGMKTLNGRHKGTMDTLAVNGQWESSDRRQSSLCVPKSSSIGSTSSRRPSWAAVLSRLRALHAEALERNS